MTEKVRKTINKIFKFSLILLFLIFSGIVIYYNLYLYFDEEISCRITEDVTVINGLFSSMYLVKSDSGYIAFDAGFDENVIRRGLMYNNIKPEDVRYMFLTHTDIDHQSAINLFKHSRIFIPHKEFQMIKNHIPRFAAFPFFFNEIKTELYDLLSENTEINAGNRNIKCIGLPGHTEGSMGYIVDGKYLFTGDAFRLKNGKLSVPLKKYFAMNINIMKKSIRLASTLHNIKYVFTSHSGFTADFKFAISGWEK